MRDRGHGEGAAAWIFQDPAMSAAAAEQAAALSAAFLRDMTENIALAARQAPIAGYVAYAPAGQEALFDGHLAAGTGLLLADGSPRCRRTCRASAAACCMRSWRCWRAAMRGGGAELRQPDAADRAAGARREALAADGDRVVLGPADDGGYYLLGMKAAHAHLFADIAWSTDSVAAATRIRARQLGLDVVELPTWYDVDDRAALGRLLEETAPRPGRIAGGRRSP